MISEDREYVQQTLAGDMLAFESLVRKYNRLGGAIAFGILGDFGSAEDVVQEALMKAYGSLSSLRKPELFRQWFTGIVRKRAIDHLRQRRSRRLVRIRLEDRYMHEARGSIPEGVLSPDDEFLREDRRKKIFEVMMEISSEDRLVLVLKYMEGLSYKEISEITNISVSAVESRLFRARKTLRDKLTHEIDRLREREEVN